MEDVPTPQSSLARGFLQSEEQCMDGRCPGVRELLKNLEATSKL